MSKSFKNTGGRYGFHSGSGKVKNFEITGDYRGRTMITMGCPQVVDVSTFPWDTTANAEQVAALAQVFDASEGASGTYRTLALSSAGAGYASNYQMFPATEGVGDAVYFGYASKFAAMYLDIDTAGVYAGDTCTWEYWNGTSWGAFTPYDETDTTAQDGQRPFQADGYVILNVGEAWQLTDVNSQNAYWIRCRITTASLTTAAITNSVEHAVTTLTNGGTIANSYGVIGRGLFRFETVSASNADTKVILVNMSTGQSSAVKTITKAIADADVADFALDVHRGDSLSFFCTQEDGSTEFAGGTCELAIDHS